MTQDSIDKEESSVFVMGWAEADITPEEVVFIGGQMHARVSEGVADPLSATAWVLQSGAEQAVFVSCDLISIEKELLAAVRQQLKQVEDETGIHPSSIIMNGTHTHTAPLIRPHSRHFDHLPGGPSGCNLEAMKVTDYIRFAAERIVSAIVEAWNRKQPGSIGYGLGYAVMGRNRRWVNDKGVAHTYRLNEQVYDTFRQIEGYEDHRVQVVGTYGATGELTGIVINVPCPSQDTEEKFVISADFWCETRIELRRRFGDHIFILPQCSAAGELVPRPLLEKAAYARMLRLKGISGREELARRLADAVSDLLPAIQNELLTSPIMSHHCAEIELPLNDLTESDVQTALANAAKLRLVYEEEQRKLEENPELKQDPRWYVAQTGAYGRMHWNMQVVHRYEQQQLKEKNTEFVEVHVVRIGDIVFATNPFELYVDFGLQLDLCSPSVQTFIVQLAGPGSYLPSERSTRGGGYGSVPASNTFGYSAGRVLVDETLQMIQEIWKSGGSI